jgi:membrane protein YqaA with SNARE-associated domain
MQEQKPDENSAQQEKIKQAAILMTVGNLLSSIGGVLTAISGLIILSVVCLVLYVILF